MADICRRFNCYLNTGFVLQKVANSYMHDFPARNGSDAEYQKVASGMSWLFPYHEKTIHTQL